MNLGPSEICRIFLMKLNYINYCKRNFIWPRQSWQLKIIRFNVINIDIYFMLDQTKLVSLRANTRGGGTFAPPWRIRGGDEILRQKKVLNLIKIMFFIWLIVCNPSQVIWRILNTKTKNLLYQIIDKKIRKFKI